MKPPLFEFDGGKARRAYFFGLVNKKLSSSLAFGEMDNISSTYFSICSPEV
jgi:hypothetical protein